MAVQLAIALAQINPTVGDIGGNVQRILAARHAAGQADLVVFPELVVVGYPPEDLVLKPRFQQAAADAVRRIAATTGDGGPALLLPTPWPVDGCLYNAVALVDGGEIRAIRYKVDLPNYGPFDEKRVFSAGPMPEPVEFRGARIGVPICEDIWTDRVTTALARQGAELFLVPNGSPYETDKVATRLRFAQERVAETRVPLVYVNQVGGQDELVFDGASFVVAGDGTVAAQLGAWQELTTVTRWTREGAAWRCVDAPMTALPDAEAYIYQALVIGLRDYVRKNGFPGVVIGLSGGIDSALTAAIGVDALGADRVLGVRLPSRYTSDLSMTEAQACADLLSIRLLTLPIAAPADTVQSVLAPVFEGRHADITEENIQARLRGVLLMALSNKLGLMLLTTGNKSEVSVGYATLYGDMCGGFAVLKDIYKTDVYRLARWRNAHRPAGVLGPNGLVIPEGTIVRLPTAELRANQTDQDTLPPYDQLDSILQDLIERECSVDECAANGHPREVVKHVHIMLTAAEYKRRQAPPGVKITSRSFGRDRRYPITNRFREP